MKLSSSNAFDLFCGRSLGETRAVSGVDLAEFIYLEGH